MWDPPHFREVPGYFYDIYVNVSGRTAKGKWDSSEVIEDNELDCFEEYTYLTEYCKYLQECVWVDGSEAYISPINSQSLLPVWELLDENNPQEKARKLDIIKRFEARGK